MPLGLVSLAANVRKENIPVQIYQPKIRITKKPDYQKAAADILNHKPTIIGFSTWCISYPVSLLIASELKKQSPKTPIIFGGPQASILSKETLTKFPFVDFIISGEADLSFPQFIEEWTKQKPDFSKVPGLTFRNDFEILQGKQTVPVTNLDKLPIPAYDLLPGQKSIKLDVGRGCPYNCTYCSTNDFFSKKYRVKSADRIISEMIKAHKEMKINSFSFAHDLLTLDAEFVLELCNKLIKLKENTGIEFSWTCSSRIDHVFDEMLIQMKKAGCNSIFFGIETGSERIQKSIKKNLNVPKAYIIADVCQKIGMEMHASFIIGFPQETKTDVEKTLKSILKLALKGVLVQISDLSLLPGTPLFDAHKKKLKFDGKFSNFSRTICTREDLNLIIKFPEVFSSFYYLPVKTLTRLEMIFICRFINRSSQFRNTLILLSENIENDLKGINLLNLYKSEFIRFKSQNRDHYTIVSFWIEILNKYLRKNTQKFQNPVIYDVFTYESFVALLLAVFTSWHILNPAVKKVKIPDDFLIKPTPFWKTITTSFKLEKIVPSENDYGEKSYRLRKGKYTYLLVAISEIKCKRIRIKEKDVILLENLSELFFSNYVKKVKTVLSEKETFSWIKRMRKLGVLEILPIT